MRPYSLFLTLLFILNLSCSKNSNSGTTPPPPPPPGGGGGSGNVTIASVSPLAFYGGDVITVTGTGFSTDITKDSIYFGNVQNGAFNYEGISAPLNTKVLSATATEIKFVTDSALPVSINNLDRSYALTVHSPAGAAFTGNTIAFKVPLVWTIQPSGPGYTNCFSIFTDDSIFLNGEGLYPPLTFTINGKALPVNSDNNNGRSARGHIPIDFYGHADPLPGCQGSSLYEFKVVNADGKTYSRQLYIYQGPASSFSYTFNASSYSLSTSNQAILHFDGYALRDDIYLAVKTLDNTDQSTTSKIINAGIGAGFPNTADVTIDLGALPKPKSNLGLIVSVNTQVGPTPPAGGYSFGPSFTLFN